MKQTSGIGNSLAIQNTKQLLKQEEKKPQLQQQQQIPQLQQQLQQQGQQQIPLDKHYNFDGEYHGDFIKMIST